MTVQPQTALSTRTHYPHNRLATEVARNKKKTKKKAHVYVCYGGTLRVPAAARCCLYIPTYQICIYLFNGSEVQGGILKQHTGKSGLLAPLLLFGYLRVFFIYFSRRFISFFQNFIPQFREFQFANRNKASAGGERIKSNNAKGSERILGRDIEQIIEFLLHSFGHIFHAIFS